tara:strand:+ start:663 stop:881 length:219 start_codon:yes stop_codon:yes gene_type:complete
MALTFTEAFKKLNDILEQEEITLADYKVFMSVPILKSYDEVETLTLIEIQEAMIIRSSEIVAKTGSSEFIFQ